MKPRTLDGRIDVQQLVLTTGWQNVQQPLAGPLVTNMHVNCSWGRPGPRAGPQLALEMHSNVLDVRLMRQHLRCQQALTTQFVEIARVSCLSSVCVYMYANIVKLNGEICIKRYEL